MEHYTGLQEYINEFLKDNINRGLILGRFAMKCNACVLIKLDIERKDDKFDCKYITADIDDIDVSDPYYTHSFTLSADKSDDLLTKLSLEYDKLLDILHTKLVACRHCGDIFGINDTNYEQYGFSELNLCNDCGLQNIYDSKYSEDKCCICLDSIGFGEYLAICGDNRHKLHIGCGKQQQICPLCKRGIEIIVESEE